MTLDKIAKNLLEDKTCSNCERDRHAFFCLDITDDTCEEWEQCILFREREYLSNLSSTDNDTR